MVREPRIIIPGWAHHITQRGNHRQNIFFNDRERLVYLRMLAKCLRVYEISLIGYCLMDNHVHLLAIPGRVDSFALGIGYMHRDFARWQNAQRTRTGHLWQSRYFCCPVEQESVWAVLAYVELNPVRALLAVNPWDWEWSSARAHANGSDATGLLDMKFFRTHFTEAGWREYLDHAEVEKAVVRRIRRATSSGRLLASEESAKKLEVEVELGRSVLPRRSRWKPDKH
jgi:putative transposase